MFIISLEFTQAPEVVDQYVESHRAYVDRFVADGLIVCAGPKVPRSGGILIARGNARDDIEAFWRNDPYALHGVARYEVTEFSILKSSEGFKRLVDETH